MGKMERFKELMKNLMEEDEEKPVKMGAGAQLGNGMDSLAIPAEGSESEDEDEDEDEESEEMSVSQERPTLFPKSKKLQILIAIGDKNKKKEEF